MGANSSVAQFHRYNYTPPQTAGEGLSARSAEDLAAQRLDPGAGAIFVLLRGAAADPASALDDAVADDRHRALTHDHVIAFGLRDAARCRLVGPRLHLAAGPPEGRRGDRLSLAAIDAGPDRVVHTLERDEPSAGIDNRGADFDVELLCFCQSGFEHAIGFVECQGHRFSPLA